MRGFFAFLTGLVVGIATGWLAARLLQERRVWLTSQPERAPARPSPAPMAQPQADRSAVGEVAKPSAPALDDLTRIRGIGPVYQRRLREAGIRTFRQLAQTPPEKLREIVAAANWQKVEPERWVEEAARLAG